MSPDSSTEPDRFFTVQDARRLVEHFSPDVPVSDDKIRRYCRVGKIAGERVDNRWVMTLRALFQAELVPLEALDAYGEVLAIPDSVPAEWVAPHAPDEPGPLERMLTADVEAHDAAERRWGGEHDESNADSATPGPGDESPSPPVSASPASFPRDQAPTSDDDDYGPAWQSISAGPQGADLSGRQRQPEPARARVRPNPRWAVLALSIAFLAAVAGIVGAVGDGSSPARVEPSAATVYLAADRARRDEAIARRATMVAAAKHGDYRVAISNAAWLHDVAAETRFRSAAAETLTDRADTAARRGDLGRARELVRQSKRYAPSNAATAVDRLVAGIKLDRQTRAAARERRRDRQAAAANVAPEPSPSNVNPAPAAADPNPSSSVSPTPSQSKPAPNSGGGSGGESGSGGSSSPVDPGIF